MVSPPEFQAEECEIQQTVDSKNQGEANPNVIFNRASNAFVTFHMFYLADSKSDFRTLNKQSPEQVTR